MSVVPATHMSLMRARKDLEYSYQKGDWDSVKDGDLFLLATLNQAFDDPQKNHEMLAQELGTILALYSEMVKSLPDSQVENWLGKGLSASLSSV